MNFLNPACRSSELHLDLRFWSRCFLLLTSILLLFVGLIREVNFNTKGVPKLVDCCTMTANNTTDEVPADLKLGGVAVVDKLVLRILYNVVDLLNSPVYICACAANEDKVRSFTSSFLTNLDRQSLFLADDSIG